MVKSNHNCIGNITSFLWCNHCHQSSRCWLHNSGFNPDVCIHSLRLMPAHFDLFYRLASGVILSIEAPSFVPFLAFARPVGQFVENKPYWFKAAFYGGSVFLLLLLV